MIRKKALAERIVTMYHGAEAAQAARASFEHQFVKRGRPTEAVLWTLPAAERWPVRQLLVDTGLAKSLGEARRKIEEGAVEAGGAAVKDPALELVPPADGRPLALRLGRRWVQVVGDPHGHRAGGEPRAGSARPLGRPRARITASPSSSFGRSARHCAASCRACAVSPACIASIAAIPKNAASAPTSGSRPG